MPAPAPPQKIGGAGENNCRGALLQHTPRQYTGGQLAIYKPSRVTCRTRSQTDRHIDNVQILFSPGCKQPLRDNNSNGCHKETNNKMRNSRQDEELPGEVLHDVL